jgi:hypothetical protein
MMIRVTTTLALSSSRPPRRVISAQKNKEKGGKNTAHTPNDNTCDVPPVEGENNRLKHPVIISSVYSKEVKVQLSQRKSIKLY